MTFDFMFFAIAIPAVIFAGVSKGGFGNGAVFASSAILALVLPPGPAIGIMLPLLLVMDASALKTYWRQWEGRMSVVVLVGALPGVMLAALIYKSVSPDVFRFLIGAIAIGFVVWKVGTERGWIKLASRPVGDLGGLVLSATGGFTSFVSHAGGPPIAVYLLSHPISKTGYQATTVLVFGGINILKMVPYAALGIFNKDTLIADLYLLPFALLGVWLGIKLHRIVPEQVFFRLTYFLLLAAGVKLIWDAMT